MKLKYSLAISILLLFCLSAKAQLLENFTDGDLNNNPNWSGDLKEFQINPGLQLQLFDTDASQSSTYLSVEAPTQGLTKWEFWVNLDFNPSTSNFAKVYLNANNPQLNQDLNGYFIQIGGISGDEDAVELYRQDGDSKSLLISGQIGGASTTPVISVRVSRDENNNWELSTDLTGGQSYTSRGTAFDDTYSQGNYFGFLCEYTSTRSEAFFFDDILIDPLFIDMQAPELTDVFVVDDQTLSVCFDEAIANSFSSSNFQLSNGIAVSSASIDPNNASKIILYLDQSLEDGTRYTLTTENISDTNGNQLSTASINFDYVEIQIASPYELLINEIMADPTPVIALPEFEFIELFNPSSKNFNLGMYGVSDGGAVAILPEFILGPMEYVIITNVDAASQFEDFGSVLGVTNFPALSNAGEQIFLYNSDNELIHQVAYSDDLYGSTEKKDGGFTLELINPGSPCVSTGNWIGSNDLTGGTPGKQNTVYNFELDQSVPEIQSVFPITVNQIELRFSKAINVFSAFEPTNYSVNNGIQITSAIAGSDPETVLLNLNEALMEGVSYELTILSIADCIGNLSTEEFVFDFALPANAEPGDIIINEILFNPPTSGVDFLELYNNSNKVINSASLIIANIEDTDIDIENVLVEELIFPNTYFTLTISPANLSSFYSIEDPTKLYENPLPGFDDKEGNVTVYTIVDGQEVILDAVDYKQDWHFGLLEDKNGVSLERISFDASTQDESNWQSAAATNGFATPTAQNSQAIVDPTTSTEGIIELIHPTFSPDQDGFEDFLQINLTPDTPGNLATIKIFDKVGRPISTLANNELVSLNSSFIWDGTTDQNTLARMGIYILWIQIHDADGNVQQFKEVVVLAKRL